MKNAGFASKSRKFRDEKEPEVEKVPWSVFAQYKSPAHNNQMQAVWVRIQKQENWLGKVKDITYSNGDQKNRWNCIELHVKIFKFRCPHVKQVSKLPKQHKVITSAERGAANPQEGFWWLLSCLTLWAWHKKGLIQLPKFICPAPFEMP